MERAGFAGSDDAVVLPRRPRSYGLSRSAGLIALFLAIPLLLAADALRVSASVTTDTLSVTVRGASDTADGALPEITLVDQRFDQVSAAIDTLIGEAAAAGETPHAQLAAAPPGMSDLELLDAHVERTDVTNLPDPDPGVRAISFRGYLTPEDPAAAPTIEVLVTVRWATALSTTPETAVFFKWSEAVLSQFVPLDLEEVELLGTWIAFRRAASADDPLATDTLPVVVPAALTPDATDYLSDGRDSTNDDFSVLPTNLDNLQGAIAFRGVIDHEGALANTLSLLGLSNTLRLDGEISVSKIDKYACPGFDANKTEQICSLGRAPRALTAVGVDLTASIPIAGADSGTLPDNVQQGADWSLHIAANTAQQAEVDLGGSFIVTISDMIAHMRATVSMEHDPVNGVDQLTVTLAGEEVENAFGLEWVDFDTVGGEFKLTSLSTTRKKKDPSVTQPTQSTSVGELGLFATMRLGSIDAAFADKTAEARFAFEGGSAGFNVELSLTTDAELSLNRLLAIAGAPQSEGFDVGVKGLELAIKFATSSDPTEQKRVQVQDDPPRYQWQDNPKTSATVAFKGTAFIGWGESDIDGTRATISTDLFTRFVIDENGILQGYFVDVRGSDGVTTTVGQLIGEDLDPDFALPSFGVSFSDRTWSVPVISLDPVTLTYTDGKPLGCGTTNAYCIREGVRLNASIHMEQGALGKGLKELGVVIDPTTPLVLSGTLPLLLESTEWGLAIQLPTFETPEGEPGVFRQGTLALAFGERTPVGGKTPEPYFELTGIATMRVASPGSEYTLADGVTTAICPDVSEGMESYPRECQDDLTFTVLAGVTADVKDGLSIIGDFGLTTGSGGWQEPLGVPGLTVHSVGMHLEVKIPITGSPEVQIGLQGTVTVENTTVNLSFLLAVTPAPPWVKPLGFTFATNSLGLGNLVELYEAVSGETVDTSNLPDLWFEDVYLAFGLENQPTLCIRQGFLLAGELHFDEDGEPTSDHGSVPTCNRNGNLPPARLADLPQSCSGDDTCLAAVLIDVQFGTTVDAVVNSHLIAKGYFAPSNIGPLDFDATTLELELSAQKQRFLVQGGVSVINPLYDPRVDDASLYYLAEGDFTLDITLSRLYVEIEGVVGGDDGLGVYIEGEAAFQDGAGTFSLDNPTFDLTVQFRSEALDRLAADIAQGFEDLGTAVEQFGPIVETALNDTGADLEQLFVDLGNSIDNVASDIQQGVIDAILGTMEDARDWIEEINTLIDDANKLFTSIGSDVHIDSVDPDDLIDIVLNGFDGPSYEIHIPGFRWPGGSCFTVEVDGTCWTVYYTLDLSFDGVCDGPEAKDHVICSGVDPAVAVAAMATDEFEQIAVSDLGLDLDAIVNGANSGVASAPLGEPGLFTSFSATSTVTSQDVLVSLNEEFTGTGVVAGCASTTLVVNADGGSQTPLDIGLEANGTTTTFGTELNLATGDLSADGQTFQNGVAQIVDDNLNSVDQTLDCELPPAPAAPPAVTIELKDGSGASATVVSKVDEGGTVWAVGTATDASTVDVDWGDGSTSTGVTVASGAWSVSHVYDDDGDFEVVATPDTGGSASARLVVQNVAPTISTSIVTGVSFLSGCGSGVRCAHTVEGNLITIEVTVTDPGVDDAHTVAVRWGDGSKSAPVDLAAGDEGPLTFSHYYVDGSDPYDDYPLLVTANDHDRRGTSLDKSTVIRVHNDAPSVESFAITSIDGCVEGPCSKGDAAGWWIEEGAPLAIDFELHDKGSYDGLTLHVDWGDGSETTVPVTASLTHPRDEAVWLASLTRTVSLEHIYLDDTGDDTTETDFTVTAWVEDRDGGDSKTATGDVPTGDKQDVEVRNDVPVVLDVVPITLNDVDVSDQDPASFTFDETDKVEFQVTVEDHGVLDDLTVDVNWGDGGYDWSSGTSTVTLGPLSAGADDCTAAPWNCDVRTTTFTHHWDDDDGATNDPAETADNPTSSDDYTVTVNATDKDDETSDDVTPTMTIDDVAPVVTTLRVTPGSPLDSLSHGIDAEHGENRSDVTVDLSFDDVSVYDSHVVTIDWGAGWTGGTVDHGTVTTAGTDPDIDVRASTERYTAFTIAPPGKDGSTTRTVSLVNRYGDNGDFTIAVDVLDDDTLRDNDDSRVLRVANEIPVHDIDRAAAVDDGTAFATVGPTAAGTTTWFGSEGSDVVFEDDANDVGSDDLTFDWWTDDHTGTRFAQLVSLDRWLASLSSYVGLPFDVLPSPLVDASQSLMDVGVLDRTSAHVTNTLTHAWDEACLYGVTAEVEDDDGGAPEVDRVPVVIQRQREPGDTKFRNFGQWKDAIDGGEVSQSTLDCYLDIAGHLSAVLAGFSELDGDDTPWVEQVGDIDLTHRDGLLPALFSEAPGNGQKDKLVAEQIKLDRALLSAYMNLADGAFAWDTELEAGVPFWRTMAEIEQVRLDSDDPKAVSDARKRLWIIGNG